MRSSVQRLAGRLASLGAVLFLVSLMSFLLVDLLPGDPSTTLLPPGTSPETASLVRRQMGLDLGRVPRYVHWVGGALRGDLGVTYGNGESVGRLLGRAFAVTIELMIVTQISALTLAVTVALLAARNAGGVFDRVVRTAISGALALPQFAVALVLILVFAVHLHWFPAVGFVHFTDDPIANLRSLVLPTIALGLPAAATYVRVLRAELVVTLASDHVMLARGLGLPERRIMVNHALRQSLSGLLAVVGLQTGMLLGGSFLIENIFALPGVGRLLLMSVGTREYFVVQGGVLVVGVGFVVVNALIDALRSRLDPRIRVRAAVA